MRFSFLWMLTPFPGGSNAEIIAAIEHVHEIGWDAARAERISNEVKP
jgi:hypothetical protein